MDLLVKGEVEIVSGYNLPMLLKAATLNQDHTLKETVAAICDSGKKYIRCFSK
jgi:mannose/fructose-specific phosphotransferase system component IIA